MDILKKILSHESTNSRVLNTKYTFFSCENWIKSIPFYKTKTSKKEKKISYPVVFSSCFAVVSSKQQQTLCVSS